MLISTSLPEKVSLTGSTMENLIHYADESSEEEEVDQGDEDFEEQSMEREQRKRARLSPLHQHFVAPLSFLADAVEAEEGTKFNVINIGLPFGKNKEAYARACYEEILADIHASRKEFRTATKPAKAAMLFVVAGSSGIGKSTFLAYFIARMSKLFKNVAICYAPKSAKTIYGSPQTDEVICAAWKSGTKVMEGTYSAVRNNLVEELPSLDLIVMDGCSMPFVNVEKFNGTVLVAASPGLYVKNLKDAIFYHRDFVMPSLHKEEARSIASMIGVPEDVVEENFEFIGGITRYLFERVQQKQKSRLLSKKLMLPASRRWRLCNPHLALNSLQQSIHLFYGKLESFSRFSSI